MHLTTRAFPLTVLTAILLGCEAPPPAAPPPAAAAPQFYLAGDSALRGMPFSEAVLVGNLLIVSGQIGNVPGKLELVPGGIGPESRQALENIRAILERHGASMQDVVKCTIFLADIGEWGAFNAAYREMFSAPYPARSALGSSGLVLGARTEVECMAVVPES